MCGVEYVNVKHLNFRCLRVFLGQSLINHFKKVLTLLL